MELCCGQWTTCKTYTSCWQTPLECRWWRTCIASDLRFKIARRRVLSNQINSSLDHSLLCHLVGEGVFDVHHRHAYSRQMGWYLLAMVRLKNPGHTISFFPFLFLPLQSFFVCSWQDNGMHGKHHSALGCGSS